VFEGWTWDDNSIPTYTQRTHMQNGSHSIHTYACICIYTYVCICMYIYTYIYIHIYICAEGGGYVCWRVGLGMTIQFLHIHSERICRMAVIPFIHMYMDIYIYICIYIYMCVCIYVYICVYMYIHIYIYLHVQRGGVCVCEGWS